MKKGISLIILIVTIVIMVILIGVVVIQGSNVLKGTQTNKLSIDISVLEGLMKTYITRKSGNIDFQTTTVNISSMTINEKAQFAGENVQDDEILLYIIEYEKIDAESLNYGNLEKGVKDRYLYSISTGKVYYELGLTENNTTYYYVKK